MWTLHRTTIPLCCKLASAMDSSDKKRNAATASLEFIEPGAVLGVGLARGIDAIDLRVVGRILVSWVVTIPAGAFLAIGFSFVFKSVLP